VKIARSRVTTGAYFDERYSLRLYENRCTSSAQLVQYEALACDYDGTIASDGTVAQPTVEALRRLRGSAKKLVLVTGRRLEDLLRVFAHTELFERIVAENGGLLYRPATGEYVPLADPPPEKFIGLLRQRGVQPLDLGRVIVATHEPQESVVLQVIRELGLETAAHIQQGRGNDSPAGHQQSQRTEGGVKGTEAPAREGRGGRRRRKRSCAARSLRFFGCGCQCLAALQEHADLVTASANGAGVVELINEMLEGSLSTSNFDPPNVS
jgi:hydroxymethylpyrimidine pyrophosphatase-like HAD family hydrolase